jgi:hypothetical protein
MPRLTEPELRAAMERVDPELRRLLIWLVTGQTVPAEAARNGLV